MFFVNYKQNDWGKLLLVTEFAYNNVKNASIGYMPFEFKCGYHPYITYEKHINPYFRSKTGTELSTKLQELMTTYRENLYHTQKLQKQAHNKAVKPRSYAPGNKVWLNSKYIKIKWDRKLEAKFFRLFWVLHLQGKQAYKLEFLKK